ncbi:hypothetical protein Q5P01_025669 [Channa striata]|uniref:Scaffolding anchor of CK1 domain-containing protein n=1 Tax=Channa striata TaxID=64152 RepID=A0AA88IR96_CHASR|nr:hypothetical protein Q5P01_025669 [Channa striata]
MESNLSFVSSLKEEDIPVYIQPHYKESYRLAIYALLCGGKEAYQEFLRVEQISHFLSEEEIFFILGHAELPVVEDESEARRVPDEINPSTYFPTESDEEVPDLDLGWPEVSLENIDTSISLLFHPPRQNTPTIKEVVRKQIQEAREVIAIAMDVFTDVDIFKEIVTATLRGVMVYILLDESQFRSFHTMSHRVGVNIQDLKNMRVRTVQGPLYQCQSGMKFHGGLEQKFLLVDCCTVVYGTYSYSWSFEKIHLSMVLVITGQLVGSYDEEFRRLYARSTVPAVLSQEKQSAQYLKDTVKVQRPSSSQLSLHQIHMRSRAMHGIRSAQDDRLYDAAILTRGRSMQDKLHQSHCPDNGHLVRGHSYGGELQKLNSSTRLRMGTKDIGAPLPPERTRSNLREGGNRLQKQQLRHQTRYGAHQNMIPFNSETSLHRWKIDAYLNENEMPVDASYEALSPMISPYSSHTGLNEYQSQVIHNRSRDIKSRMEEMRQKRFSLQEYVNFRQSQESLRSMYSAERPKYISPMRGQDKRQCAAELEANAQSGRSMETSTHKGTEPNKESNKREQNTPDGQRSASHYDANVVSDRKTPQTYDRHEPLTRTMLAADSDMKPNDPSLKRSHLQSSSLSIQHTRAMECLTEVPEEKESSNARVNNSDSVAINKNEEVCKGEKSVLNENSHRQDKVRGSYGSIGKVANSLGSLTETEGTKSVSSDAENAPRTFKNFAGTQHALEAKTGDMLKQQEEPALQRRNSTRTKVHSMLSSEEKKASKKEKSVQRKASIKSQNSSGSNQTVRADNAVQSVNGLPTGSLNSISSSSDMEKHKPPFSRFPSFRSSKRKTNLAAEQDQGLRSTVSSDDMTISQTKTEKAYSPYEYLLNTNRSASLKRQDSGYAMQQTEGGTDNKLGRFMQRMGNLINKNK